jgi:hypothetical protein
MSEPGSFITFVKDFWEQFVGFILLIVGITRSEMNIRRTFNTLYDKEENLKLVSKIDCNKCHIDLRSDLKDVSNGIDKVHDRIDELYKLIAEGKK